MQVVRELEHVQGRTSERDTSISYIREGQEQPFGTARSLDAVSEYSLQLRKDSITPLVFDEVDILSKTADSGDKAEASLEDKLLMAARLVLFYAHEIGGADLENSVNTSLRDLVQHINKKQCIPPQTLRTAASQIELNMLRDRVNLLLGTGVEGTVSGPLPACTIVANPHLMAHVFSLMELKNASNLASTEVRAKRKKVKPTDSGDRYTVLAGSCSLFGVLNLVRTLLQ
eukprot:1864368-Prymnesium_polylepis.1